MISLEENKGFCEATLRCCPSEHWWLLFVSPLEPCLLVGRFNKIKKMDELNSNFGRLSTSAAEWRPGGATRTVSSSSTQSDLDASKVKEFVPGRGWTSTSAATKEQAGRNLFLEHQLLLLLFLSMKSPFISLAFVLLWCTYQVCISFESLNNISFPLSIQDLLPDHRIPNHLQLNNPLRNNIMIRFKLLGRLRQSTLPFNRFIPWDCQTIYGGTIEVYR